MNASINALSSSGLGAASLLRLFGIQSDMRSQNRATAVESIPPAGQIQAHIGTLSRLSSSTSDSIMSILLQNSGSISEVSAKAALNAAADDPTTGWGMVKHIADVYESTNAMTSEEYQNDFYSQAGIFDNDNDIVAIIQSVRNFGGDYAASLQEAFANRTVIVQKASDVHGLEFRERNTVSTNTDGYTGFSSELTFDGQFFAQQDGKHHIIVGGEQGAAAAYLTW
jgi:hypothetical protein